MVRFVSCRWMDISTSGTASLIKPGLLPVLCTEARPRAHAASIRLRRVGSMLAGWWNWPVVATTFVPAASSRHTSSASGRAGM